MMVVEASAFRAALKIRHGGGQNGGDDQTGQADGQMVPDEFGIDSFRDGGAERPVSW